MKCCRDIVRSALLRSDMFAALPTLRFNGETAYESMIGGCLSIILVVAFAAIFYTSFVNVLTKVNVIASVQVEDDPYGDQQISDISMAVGIKGIDFSSYNRYFDLVLVTQSRNLGQLPTRSVIPLVPCSIEYWKNQGNNFEKLFTLYEMNKMLCAKPGTNFTLQGFQGSKVWDTMQVRIDRCVNVTAAWQCYSPPVISAFMNTYLAANDYFKVQLYFTNTIISPHKKQYLSKVLEDEIFLSFSRNTGSRGIIKIGYYQITTDQSIWPFTEEVVETGHYISNVKTSTIQLMSTHYVLVQIQKARSIYKVSRQHEKLDEMLSYVGGLFALLFGLIAFFFGSYNQYKYEIAVAESSFALDETGRKIREKNFGFLTYLQYSIYDWLSTFHCKLNWKKMEEINEAREEAVQQMDIKLIMKKLERFERINELLLGEHNLVCANLMRPPTLEQVKRIRKIVEYYDKVIKVEQQESILSTFLPMGDLNKINTESMEVEDSDFDSEDEKAEKAIIQAQKQLESTKNMSDLSKRILGSISPSMRQRLSRKRALYEKRNSIDGLVNCTQNNLENQSVVSNNNRHFTLEQIP